MSYALHITNSGNQGATGIVLSAHLPINTTFNSAASTSGWQQVGTTTEYKLAVSTLPAGGSGDYVFAVTIANPVPAGLNTIPNSFSITDDLANGADPTPSNNMSVTSTIVNAAPDLTLSKNDGNLTAVLPGTTITYTLTYSNIGNQGASGVTITETLPANTTFDAAHSGSGWQQVDTSNSYRYAVASLNANGNGSVQFSVVVSSTPPDGMTNVSNTAMIADDGDNGTDPVSLK